MANFVQNQRPDGAAGQPPIVLAKLPRVGQVSPQVVHPVAQATMPPPQEMPQLDLRTEIDQRTRLHIAEPAADDQAIPASHYADRQHASSRPEPLPAPRIHQPELQRQTAAIAKPTNFGEILSRFHTQLAPHAGLIVALALIAAGGLLYWMIVGPAQTPPPNWQGDSQEFGQDTLLGKETFSLPNALTPNSPERLTAQGGLAQPENLTNNWQTVPLPGPPQTLSPPTASAPTLAPSQATGQLQFPATSHPQGLDFTKIGTQPMRAIDLKAPSLLPAVAQGSTATKNR